MKYVKIMMNLAAMLMTPLILYMTLKIDWDYIKNYPAYPDYAKSEAPSILWPVFITIVFPFWIYKFDKYVYKNFLVEQKFYKHLIIVIIPILMLIVFVISFIAGLNLHFLDKLIVFY